MDVAIKCILIIAVVIGTIATVIIIWLAFYGNVKIQVQSYTAQGENTSLDIKTEAGTLRTEYCDGDRVCVEYPVTKCFRTKIYESEGTFHFENRSRAFFFLFIGNKIPEIVVKIPRGSSYNIALKLSAGKVNLADGKFGNAELKMSAGTFRCEGICCSDLKLDISAGTMYVGNADCNSLAMHVSAGSAQISSLTCPNAKLKISAGSARLGLTGNREEYRIFTNVSAGSCNVASQEGTTDKVIDVKVSAGSAKLEFEV